MRLQQKTQNHTHQTAEKHKIAHQKTNNHIPDYRRNYRSAHPKTQNCTPDCSKKQQKNHIPDCSKNSNLNHTKIARKNTYNHTAFCRQQNTHTQNQTPKLQQKTQNHIVPDCRKKHKADTEGGSSGHRVRPRHKAWGGKVFLHDLDDSLVSLLVDKHFGLHIGGSLVQRGFNGVHGCHKAGRAVRLQSRLHTGKLGGDCGDGVRCILCSFQDHILHIVSLVLALLARYVEHHSTSSATQQHNTQISSTLSLSLSRPTRQKLTRQSAIHCVGLETGKMRRRQVHTWQLQRGWR